jgi:hypothetical protein
MDTTLIALIAQYSTESTLDALSLASPTTNQLAASHLAALRVETARQHKLARERMRLCVDKIRMRKSAYPTEHSNGYHKGEGVHSGTHIVWIRSGDLSATGIDLYKKYDPESDCSRVRSRAGHCNAKTLDLQKVVTLDHFIIEQYKYINIKLRDALVDTVVVRALYDEMARK